MNWRVAAGRFFVRLGEFLPELAVMVMRPRDLVEFSRRSYSTPGWIDTFCRPECVDSGLLEEEKELLQKIPGKGGSLLLLGVGGGREAIPLAKMGYEVTGVDFVADMVRRAGENAKCHGVQIKGLIQDIAKLDVPAASFDLAWLSAVMYSSIPGSRTRIAMARRIGSALKPGGLFLCQFQLARKATYSRAAEFVKKTTALLSLGNFRYERGDMLWGNREFIHAFGTAGEVEAELREAGFAQVHLHLEPDKFRAGALFKKNGS